MAALYYYRGKSLDVITGFGHKARRAFHDTKWLSAAFNEILLE
jgi:hypothetical protein